MDVKSLSDLIAAANGTCPNPQMRKAATKQLDDMKYKTGYPSTLLRIWQSNQNEEARTIAMIMFKNDVKKMWPAAQQSSLDGDKVSEKEKCKAELLNNFLNEKSEQVSKQVNMAISNLARMEISKKNWGNLFPTLISILQKDNQSSFVIYRTMSLITQILTQLCSMRLAFFKQFFQLLNESLLPQIMALWNRMFKTMFDMFAALFSNSQSLDPSHLVGILSVCHLASQSIQLLLDRYTQPYFTKDTLEAKYIQSSVEALRMLHDQIYPKLSAHPKAAAPPLKSVVDKVKTVIELLSYTVSECHKNFTVPFRNVLPNVLSYYYHIATNVAEKRKSNTHFMNETVVQSLLFIKDVMSNDLYWKETISSGISFSTKVSFDKQGAAECRLLAAQFFTQQRVSRLVTAIVGDLFVLSADDLNKQGDDPTNVYHEMTIEHNDCNIRAAAKTIFNQLIKRSPDVCAPVVVQMFIAVSKDGLPDVAANNASQALPYNHPRFPSLIRREAVYLAFGLSYFHLKKTLLQNRYNFNAVFQQQISTDLQYLAAPFVVSRATWLVGRLKEDVNEHRNTRELSYQMLVAKLRPQPLFEKDSEMWNRQLLIRINAANALIRLINDAKFESEEFDPFLGPCSTLLLRLVGDCEGCLDVMTAMMKQLSTLIKRCRETITQSDKKQGIVQSVIQIAPKLWEQCNTPSTNLFRQSIVELLTQIVKCMNPSQVHNFYIFLMPVLLYSTDCADNDKDYIIEHGIDLWHTVIYNSNRLTKETHQLFSQHWTVAMQDYSDYFRGLMDLLKSYLLIGKEDFVSKHGAEIGQSLMTIAPEIVQHGTDYANVVDVLCIFTQLYPSQSPNFLKPIIEVCLKSFLKDIQNTHDAANGSPSKMVNINSTIVDINEYQATGVDPDVITAHTVFFSRLLIENATGLIGVIQKIEQENNIQILDSFFKAMVDSKQYIKVPHKLKLVLFSTCTIAEGLPLNQLQPMLCSAVPWWFAYIKDYEIDSLSVLEFETDSDLETYGPEWNETDRITALSYGDRVNRTFAFKKVESVFKSVCQKVNINLEKMLTEIAGKTGVNSLLFDWKSFYGKHQKYIQEKSTMNSSFS